MSRGPCDTGRGIRALIITLLRAGNTVNRQKSLLRLLPVLALFVAGCVYIPTPEHEEPIIPHSQRGRVTADALKAFIPGKSDRADVLLALGEPSLRESDDRYLVYRWTATQGYMFILLPGVPPGSIKNVHDLVFEFDGDGRLERFETFDDGVTGERKKEIEAWKDRDDGETPLP